MESKKVNKKLNSILWFALYSLPLLVLLISYVGYLATFKETGVSDFINDNTLFDNSLNLVNSIFGQFNWTFIKDSLVSVFDLLEFNITGNLSEFLLIFFTWFIQLAFIHILVDVLVFIPRALHNLMERWS